VPNPTAAAKQATQAAEALQQAPAPWVPHGPCGGAHHDRLGCGDGVSGPRGLDMPGAKVDEHPGMSILTGHTS